MKKTKILIPIATAATLAATITPLTVLTGCNNNHVEAQGSIPVEFLNIDKEKTLHGFKPGVDLSKYDTLSIPASVTVIDSNAFARTTSSGGWETILPKNIINLVFEEDSEWHATNCKTIREYAFYGAPIKHVKLCVGVSRIFEFAFSHSAVEDCYFPPFLTSIGEEAFSYTNLYSVAFNVARAGDQAGYDTMVNAPWARAKFPGQITGGSALNEVGEKAFYNCKNLTYLKPSFAGCTYALSSITESYTVQGRSPFAMFDPISGMSTKSNIKILDFSDYWPYSSGTTVLDQWDIGVTGLENFNATFGVEVMEHPGSVPSDNLFILEDSSWESEESFAISKLMAFANKIQQGIACSPAPTSKSIGNWRVANRSEWNLKFAKAVPFEETHPSLVIKKDEGGIGHYLLDNCYTYLNYPETRFFPNDFEFEVVSEKWKSEDSKDPLPELKFSIVAENDTHYLQVEVLNLEDLTPGNVALIELRVKSKQLGIDYLYGVNEIWEQHPGSIGTIDSSIVLTLPA